MYLFLKDWMLWKTDGTEAGTMAVTEIANYYASATTVAKTASISLDIETLIRIKRHFGSLMERLPELKSCFDSASQSGLRI